MLLAGACFTLVAAVGVVRFRDVFTRAHAFGVGATLGMVLALLGAAVTQSKPGIRTTLILAVVLQVLTSPLSTNLLSRATYLATGTRDRARAEGTHVAESPVAVVAEEAAVEAAPDHDADAP